MTFPDVEYLRWAKSLPAAEINLAEAASSTARRRCFGSGRGTLSSTFR
jgi:hypothetical protein